MGCRHPPFRRSTPYRRVRRLQGKDATRPDSERERQEEGKGPRRPFHRSSQPPLRIDRSTVEQRRVAKPFLCVEKEYQEPIKEKYISRTESIEQIKEKYISRTESISKNKNKKKESNIETLAISCWI